MFLTGGLRWRTRDGAILSGRAAIVPGAVWTSTVLASILARASCTVRSPRMRPMTSRLSGRPPAVADAGARGVQNSRRPSGNLKAAGITPTTSKAWLSRRTVRPTIPGSAPKRLRHDSSLKTMTCAPVRASDSSSEASELRLHPERAHQAPTERRPCDRGRLVAADHRARGVSPSVH